MKKRAIIYARQSSGADDYSESVEVQITNCRNLAAREHITVVEIFSDLNISGKTYPEGWNDLAFRDQAFQRWLAQNSSRRSTRIGFGKVMMRLSQIDYIIVDDITRLYRPLSRSFLEAAVNDSLIVNNVQILQVKGGKLDMAQFDQQLVTMLKNQINDEQIAKQRQRSIEVLNKLRDSGIMPTGITAFGLIYDKQSKSYTLDQQRCQVVKYIFEQVLNGKSYGELVREINRRWSELFRGYFWEKSLYEILRKPIYAGFQYNSSGNLIKNNQGEAVITLDTFLQVQTIMAQRRLKRFHLPPKAAHRHWMPLSGMLFCGNCGSRLTSVVEDGKIVYVCRRGSLCSDPACRASRISMRCNKPYLAGLIDAVQAVLGIALLKLQQESADKQLLPANRTAFEERLQEISLEFARGNITAEIFHAALQEINLRLRSPGNAPFPADTSAECFLHQKHFGELLSDYCRNSFSQEDFSSLLQRISLRIDVWNEKIVITSGEYKFEFLRRTICRQKGFSAHMVGKLRRQFAAVLEKNLKKQ